MLQSKVAAGRHLEFDQVDIFTVCPYLKQHILFDSNGLDIWQGFPVTKYIQVESGHRSAILNLMKLKFPRYIST